MKYKKTKAQTAYFSKGERWLLVIKQELGQALGFFFLSIAYKIQVITKRHILSDQYLSPPGTDPDFTNFSTFEDL